MTILNGTDKIISHIVTGRFGYALFGHKDAYSGIYKRYRNHGKKYWLRTKFYWTPNVDSVAQQVGRTKFAAAVASWQALTAPQKAVYNERARFRKLSGYNLYIREQMYI